jgi:parallel beta-helix repeat protein
MPFTATYAHLSEREPWKNEFYNQLVRDLSTSLTTLDGALFATPFVLAGDMDGDCHGIYGFAEWFGSGVTGVCVRDVTGYGALGDGVADDTAAIQAAIDACPSAGGIVFIPPGTYKVSGGIAMYGTSGTARNNITIRGAGSGTVLNLDAGGYGIYMGHANGSTGMAIENLKTVFTTPADFDRPTISMKNTSFSVVHNVDISGTAGVGIEVQGSSANAIVNCTIVASASDGISQRPEVGGPTIYPTNNLQVIGCTIDTSGKNGIALYNVSNVLISDCKILASGHSGIVLTAGVYDGVSLAITNVSISGCDISGSGVVDATTYNGIGIVCRCGYNVQAVTGLTISGNTIHENLHYGVYLLGGDWASVTKFSICGNTINNNTEDGVVIHAGRHGSFVGNTVSDNGTNGLRIGSGLPNYTRYVTVDGNAITNPGGAQEVGLYILPVTAECVFVNNVCEGTTYDIYALPNAAYNSSCEIAHNIGTVT